MANEEFVYKPVSERNGNLVVLLPSSLPESSQVSLVDANGNVLETGSFAERGNGNRATYQFGKPGSQYGSNVSVQITDPSGSTSLMPIGQGGQRVTSQGLNPSSMSVSSGGGGGYTPQTMTSPGGGNTGVIPGFANWGGLQSPFVDFESALDFAQTTGQMNRDIFFQELTGDQAKQAALGLVGTDIEGIQKGISTLGPMAREQGQLDLQTNIARAGELDKFNIGRIPGFNAANIQAARQATEEAQRQQQEAVASTGLDFQGRIGDVLKQLEAQTKGQLPSDLDTALTTRLRNRGADITAASGVSGVSPAGRTAQDLLDVEARLNLSQQALQQLPSVLTQGQAVLQPPVVTAPTMFAQPTDVPLNVSNIEARMPIQSSISAGATQQNLGATAADIKTISAENVLATGISTQQFNEQAEYNRDLTVLNAEQGWMNAVDTAYANAYNADKMDELRAEEQAQFEAGLDQARLNQWISAGGTIAGAAIPEIASWLRGDSDTAPAQVSQRAPGTTTTTPQTTQQVTPQANTQGSTTFVDNLGAGNAWTAIENAAGSGIDWFAENVVDPAMNYFNSGATETKVGNFKIGRPQAQSMVDEVSKVYSPTDFNPSSGIRDMGAMRGRDPMTFIPEVAEKFNASTPSDAANSFGPAPKEYEGQKVISSTIQDGKKGYTLADGSFVEATKANAAQAAPSPIDTMSTALPSPAQDHTVLNSTTQAMSNWDNLGEGDKIRYSSDLGKQILTAKGLVSGEEQRLVSSSMDAVTTLINPAASDEDKAIALATASNQAATTQFTGSIQAPNTINGKPVIGSSNVDGKPGFMVQNNDGTTSTVSRQELEAGANIASGLSALSILNSNADKTNKVTALMSTGMDAAKANSVVNSYIAGNSLAALSVFNTAYNWEDMNPIQKGIATIQTSSAVMSAASNYASTGASTLASGVAQNLGLEGISNLIPTAGQFAAGASIVNGVVQAADTVSFLDDVSKSQAATQGPIQLGLSGGQIGAGVGGLVGGGMGTTIGLIGGLTGGAAVGAVAGHTGTGKNSGQLQRDEWRNGLRQAGIASKDHQVTLADGSKYDIGKDGGAKLVNKDGTERHTYEVDWSNPTTAESIPAAHLFAIATGLNPNDNDKFETFNNATSQALNAAQSNAATRYGVQDNIKSMLGNANIGPAQITSQVDLLYAQNKISDQEYGVYVDTINSMYGTKLQPSNKDKVRAQFVNAFSSQKKLTKPQKDILASLTQEDWLQNQEKRTNDRLAKSVESTRKNAVMGQDEFLKLASDAVAMKRLVKRRMARVRG